MRLIRQPKEIDALLLKAEDIVITGQNPFWGMTYVEGVIAGIEWVLGENDDNPLDA